MSIDIVKGMMVISPNCVGYTKDGNQVQQLMYGGGKKPFQGMLVLDGKTSRQLLSWNVEGKHDTPNLDIVKIVEGDKTLWQYE